MERGNRILCLLLAVVIVLQIVTISKIERHQDRLETFGLAVQTKLDNITSKLNAPLIDEEKE